MKDIERSLISTKMEITRLVNYITDTVEAVYQKLLIRGNKTHREMQATRTLLHLIMAARRPFSLTELEVALQRATDNSVHSYKELECALEPMVVSERTVKLQSLQAAPRGRFGLLWHWS